MDFNKFTVKLQEAVETANQYAGEQNHSQLEISMQENRITVSLR